MENLCRIDDETTYKRSYSNNENIYPFRQLPELGKKRKIVLLGATGSVGESTLRVIREHSDRLELAGIAAGRRAKELDAIALEFDVDETSLYSREGSDGLERLATLPDADIVLVATTGTVALRAVLAALAAGKDVAIANKETLVVAGHIVMAAEQLSEGRIFPVDSEHNAIFQCLEGNRTHGKIRRLLLTASGGAFRDRSAEELKYVTVEDALQHPNWSMGPKITVDSATMANKGLEMMEAGWLFGVPHNKIDVVIHPQSIVHSMVEFCDNSIIAQMSRPSMTFAIQHALMYPERSNGIHESLDFTQALSLDFRPPDEERFPCLRLAREAMVEGGINPLVFNAANEAAVEAFMNKRLSFIDIPNLISDTLEQISGRLPDDVDDLIEFEASVNVHAAEIIQNNY